MVRQEGNPAPYQPRVVWADVTDWNILYSAATWVVIPVNCRGVSGAGLARAAADLWPLTMAYYREWCRPGRGPGLDDGLLAPGRALQIPIIDPNPSGDPRTSGLILLASKDRWQDPSRLEWVTSGLRDVAGILRHHRVVPNPSVAVPAVGCGCGGLEWANVEPLVVSMADAVPEARVIIYPPGSGQKTVHDPYTPRVIT
jgi:O-acetyl-ADP-ribose deacetylase (regulator of RNase III)